MIRCQVLMTECFSRVDTLARVEDEHFFEQVESERIGTSEFLGEGDSLTLREGLDETQGLILG